MNVRIVNPCSENWDLMSPKEKGRHCNKCEKVVMDYTKMTDGQIIKYLHNNPGACGRFTNVQQSGELQLPTLSNPWSTMVKQITFSSLFFGNFLLSHAQDNQISTDSSRHEMHLKEPQKIPTSIVKGKIHSQKMDKDRLLSIHFKIDKFAIFIPVDSNHYSFTLPKSSKKEKIEVTLKTADTSFIYELQFPLDDPSNINVHTIDFFYNDSIWRHRIPLIQQAKILAPIIPTPIVVGIPPINPYIIFLEDSIHYKWIPIKLNVKKDSFHLDTAITEKETSSDSINIDSMNRGKKEFQKTIVYEKRKNSIWWWLVPVGIVFAIGVYQWKKTRKQTNS